MQTLTKEENISNEVNSFNKMIKDLSLQIKEWLNEKKELMKSEEKDFENFEEYSGNYKTKIYLFSSKSYSTFSLKPYGIWIVGAKCGIHIIGKSGKEYLVYMFKGGPSTQISVKEGEKVISQTNDSVYGNLSEGWYWLNQDFKKKPELLTKDLFFELLEIIN